jgi:hypothetical protein
MPIDPVSAPVRGACAFRSGDEMSTLRHAKTVDMAEWAAVALGAALAVGLMLLGSALARAAVL